MPKPRALFLDRDGVINHDSGYTHKIEDFRFIEGIFDLCRVARELGYQLVVATNQAGIGRGLYTESDFLHLTEWMKQRFSAEGAPLAAVYHCPYHPEGIGRYRQRSDWRKPEPGMLLQAARDLNLDLSKSVMIGDNEHDVTAAKAAGLAAAILLGEPGRLVTQADIVLAAHAEIAVWLKGFSKTH